MRSSVASAFASARGRAQRLAQHERPEPRRGHVAARARPASRSARRRRRGSGLPPYLPTSKKRWSESQSESKPAASARIAKPRGSPSERGLARDREVVLRQRQADTHADPVLSRGPSRRVAPVPVAWWRARVRREHLRGAATRRRSTAWPAPADPTLLDVHTDPDHHRSVFTIAGPVRPRRRAVRHAGSRRGRGRPHARRPRRRAPRLGVIDVVPFVAPGADADRRARSTRPAASRPGSAPSSAMPAFLYDLADPNAARSRGAPRRVRRPRARRRPGARRTRGSGRPRSAPDRCWWR